MTRFLIFLFMVSYLGISQGQVLTENFEIKEWEKIEFKKYGMSVDLKKVQGINVTTISDLKNGETTIMEYDRKHNITKVSRLDPKRNPITIESRAGNQLVFTYFQTTPLKKVIQTHNQRGGYLKEIYTKAKASDEWKKISEKEVGPKGAMICNESMNQLTYTTSVNRFLNDSRDVLDFSLGTRIGGYKQLGNNAIAKDCIGIQPLGEQTLIEDLEASFNQGMGCMETLFTSYHGVADANVRRRANDIRAKARKVMGNFVNGANRHFTIECNPPITQYPDEGWQAASAADPENHIGRTTHAFAATCEGGLSGESIVPGIQLNLSWYNENQNKPNVKRSTLFHEMLHHAGVYHDTEDGELDWVYSMQFCCFGLDEDTIPAMSDISTGFTCGGVLSADHGSPRASIDEINRVRELSR